MSERIAMVWAVAWVPNGQSTPKELPEGYADGARWSTRGEIADLADEFLRATYAVHGAMAWEPIGGDADGTKFRRLVIVPVQP